MRFTTPLDDEAVQAVRSAHNRGWRDGLELGADTVRRAIGQQLASAVKAGRLDGDAVAEDRARRPMFVGRAGDPHHVGQCAEAEAAAAAEEVGHAEGSEGTEDAEATEVERDTAHHPSHMAWRARGQDRRTVHRREQAR